MKGFEFIVFGNMDQIKSDEEFENCITLEVQNMWENMANG